MPELPEVETIRRGIAKCVVGAIIDRSVLRARLRFPMDDAIDEILPKAVISSITRRAKYLLFNTDKGTLLMHFGMSGSLRLMPEYQPPEKHDHMDVVLEDGRCLRYTDPRRFGMVLWLGKNPMDHSLLCNLGPEPLHKVFNSDYLYEKSRGRKLAIKSFLMDAKIVAGVGNIYASESLFIAGIAPQLAAGAIDLERYGLLVAGVKAILKAAIRQGGTSIRNFMNIKGKPGYFRVALKVYGRAGEPCDNCSYPVAMLRLNQRSTFYCPQCQN